jgi:hypothetical protein
MSLKHVDHNLKQDAWGQLAAGTVPGMAYFAGTGPLGSTCGECRHCALAEKAKTPHCAKAAAMLGKRGPNIRKSIAACKYFENKKQ